MLRPWIALTMAGMATVVAGIGRASAAEPPPAPREFRAAWVATVANIDWPTKPGLSTADQQREAVAILDRAAEMNLNAIVLQIRTAADALYESKYEPWSYYLTGTQGKKPDPYYDPLKFWIDEAHARGIQLHAWFNPYRARIAGAKYEESPDHVSKAHPELVKTYVNMLWMDPGEPEAREQSYKVFLDVVKRYDVDGIHIDDYFYPYPVAGEDRKELDFPDDASWKAYQSSGGKLGRADWRRSNINALIESLYKGIKQEKRQVQFGISPFGIPRPGRAPGVEGFDQYEKLYADAQLWLNEGWCDYWVPQLYWKIDAPKQAYKTLLSYWVAENTHGRNFWPGNIPSRIGGGPTGWDSREIVDQVEATRATPGATGNVYFSMKVFMENRRGVVDLLKQGPYREPALVPPSPWLGAQAPAEPKAKLATDVGGSTLSIEPGPGEPPFQWAVFAKRGDAWEFSTHPGRSRSITLKGDSPTALVISAVGRLGDESRRVTVDMPAAR